MNNIEEIIKNILYIVSIISGSIMIISLFAIVTIRMICFAIDHLKTGLIIKECLKIYIKQKRPTLKVETEDIDFTKRRIKKW